MAKPTFIRARASVNMCACVCVCVYVCMCVCVYVYATQTPRLCQTWLKEFQLASLPPSPCLQSSLTHTYMHTYTFTNMHLKNSTITVSYFSFLRFLVMLNLIIFLLMFSFVMLPIIVAPKTSGNITYNQNDGCWWTLVCFTLHVYEHIKAWC